MRGIFPKESPFCAEASARWKGVAMYQLKPIPMRVAAIREKYRTTKPRIDINRYRLVTEFYMENPGLTGILKRARTLRLLFEKMPVLINEDEVIVGWQGASYRCCATRQTSPNPFFHTVFLV